eukprot:1763446-Pyramimonas_sp.AAC.1
MWPTAECDGNASYERSPPQATLLNSSRRQTAPDRNGLGLVVTRGPPQAPISNTKHMSVAECN